MSDRDAERKIADFVRKWFGIDEYTWVDVVKCITSGKIWTIKGVKRLVLEIVSASDAASSEMLGVDAITISGKDLVVIKVAEQVYKDALAANKRARWTLAHELGHAVLCHPREALARITGAGRSTPMSSAVRKLEGEANRFASFFLVKEELAVECESVETLSDWFGVSLAVAENWFQGKSKNEARPRIISGFEKLLNDLNGKAKSTGVSFAQSVASQEANSESSENGLPCYCTQGRLRPLACGKYKCDCCGRVIELPDGDSLGSQTSC